MNKSDQKKRQRIKSDSDSDDDQSNSKRIHSDGYDDKYRGNADDRAWLETLSERERETELLKRHEQREVLKHREEISRKLSSRLKKDNEQVKSESFDQNIYAQDDEDDKKDNFSSVTTRRKQANEIKQKETDHSKSLELLIEKRKKKQDEQIKQNEKWEVDLIYQTSSSDDDEDEDEDDRQSRSPKKKENETKSKKATKITTKSELKPMVLTRFRMEKWCHAPFFKNVAKGSFVRINIGQNNGVPVYRVCEILDVVETGKVYSLGSTRTNKGLRLKHGRNERVFRLEFVSNREMSDAEFQRWRDTTIRQGGQIPTLADRDAKMKIIDKYKQYVYSNREISKIVEEKSRFRKAPINYAMTKTELLKEIETAQMDKNLQKENELRRKLDEMEQRASELDRKRTENISVMAQINQRNRKKTQQNVEMALAREAQEHRNAKADPFTRRRCAPILVSKAPQTKEELIRELQIQRATEEAAAAKKKLEEERLLAEKNKVKHSMSFEFSTDLQKSSDKNLTTWTTNKRGSLNISPDKNDDMFDTHNFELDFPMKFFPEQF